MSEGRDNESERDFPDPESQLQEGQVSLVRLRKGSAKASEVAVRFGQIEGRFSC